MFSCICVNQQKHVTMHEDQVEKNNKLLCSFSINDVADMFMIYFVEPCQI